MPLADGQASEVSAQPSCFSAYLAEHLPNPFAFILGRNTAAVGLRVGRGSVCGKPRLSEAKAMPGFLLYLWDSSYSTQVPGLPTTSSPRPEGSCPKALATARLLQAPQRRHAWGEPRSCSWGRALRDGPFAYDSSCNSSEWHHTSLSACSHPPFILETGFPSPAIFILVLLESSYNQNKHG